MSRRYGLPTIIVTSYSLKMSTASSMKLFNLKRDLMRGTITQEEYDKRIADIEVGKSVQYRKTRVTQSR